MNFFGPTSNEPGRCERKKGRKSFLKSGLGMSYLLACTRRQTRRHGSEQLTYLLFLKMAYERNR